MNEKQLLEHIIKDPNRFYPRVVILLPTGRYDVILSIMLRSTLNQRKGARVLATYRKFKKQTHIRTERPFLQEPYLSVWKALQRRIPLSKQEAEQFMGRFPEVFGDNR